MSLTETIMKELCRSLRGRKLELFIKLARGISLRKAAAEMGLSPAAACGYGNKAKRALGLVDLSLHAAAREGKRQGFF